MRVALQYLLPQHALGRLARALSLCRVRWLKDLLISQFVRSYRPDLREAAEPEPRRYASFNAFFTRALRPGARPLDADLRRIVSPCDGTLSSAGHIEGEQLLQAKQRHYTLPELLGGESTWAERLRAGLYATVYLAPSDYHRVHLPLPGTLRSAIHVPGRLFSVNEASVARIPRLFARNERLVCLFEGASGPFALVLVGALLVGGISTVWHGDVEAARARGRGPRIVPLRTSAALEQPRGAEIGRFNMGSTVILLLPRQVAQWDEDLLSGRPLRVGQGIGTLSAGAAVPSRDDARRPGAREAPRP